METDNSLLPVLIPSRSTWMHYSPSSNIRLTLWN